MAGALLAGVARERQSRHEGTLVSFLSVGQGDCTVVMSDGWVVLVDVGPKSDTFDAGARLVVPELRRLGVRQIDCLVLTHPDSDHVGGLGAVMRRYRVGRVVVSAAFQRDENMLAWLEGAGVTPEQVAWLNGPAVAELGGITLTLAPPPFGVETSDNDRSLFVRIDVGAGSVAMSGDAGMEVEKAIGGDWDVQVLKAGHHGSNGSTGVQWLGATTPEVVVASCGRRNTYGHPHPDMVQRVQDAGAEFLSTDRDGSVTFVLGGSGFVRETN
ncbi:MAG: MBL fold metallo-hydrolase [Armatimonadetes bacterium]|nr:MBL fold metallo-hydrolase [Armatimonadota bacterium]